MSGTNAPLLPVETDKTSRSYGYFAGFGILALTALSLCAAMLNTRTNADNLLATKMALRRSAPTQMRMNRASMPVIPLKSYASSPRISRCTSVNAMMMPSSMPRGSFSPKTLASSPDREVSVNSLFGLGLPELVVIGGVAALIFGPSKLPEFGKQLGVTAKSLGSAVKEFNEELKDELKTEEENAAAKDAVSESKKTEEKTE